MLEVLEAAETTDLTTVSAVESEIDGFDTAARGWVEKAISFASSQIEQEANMFFAYQQYQETIAGSGSTLLMLSRTPIIGTPTILNTDNEPIVDFATEDAEAGLLYRRQGWTREVSYFPGISRDFDPVSTHPSFIIDYYAGYLLPPEGATATPPRVVLPPHVEYAAILAVKSWYNKKGQSDNVSWKQVGDLALGYRKDDPGDSKTLRLPPEARALIRPRIV